MEIRFYQKNVYGNDLRYALDHHEQIKTLTKQETLSESMMKALEGMGFTFKEITITEADLIFGRK